MQKYIHTTWRLWKLLKPFHKDFYIQLLYTVVIQLISIFTVFILSKILDSLVLKNINNLTLFIISYLIVGCINNYLYGKSAVHNLKKLEQNIIQYLQEYSFTRIFRLNPSQYYEDHTSIKLQVIDRGENAVDEIISTGLLNFLPIIIQVLLSLVAISFYSVYSALWCLITMIVIIFWANKFSNYHRPFLKKNIDSWDGFRKIRTESFSHLSLVKLFNVQNKYISKYLVERLKSMNFHIETWLPAYKHANRRTYFLIIARTFNTFIITFTFLKGGLLIGGVYAMWSWAGDIFSNITSIQKIIRRLPLRFVELEKYLEIIDKEPDFKEESDTKFVDGDITFSNLSFKYPKGDSNVLENININIPHGKKVAFVGASGSGKTTITRLLLRAYDYKSTQDENGNKLAGSIEINGVELKEIDAHSLRRSIGYVEQHVDLFDDTIKNNILLGVDEKALKNWEKEDVIGEKLEEIAKLSRIDEFYHRLGEQKFETHIGERGIKLSGGERQRIGIARAIIKNPSILIFDEATSALDTVNEKYIKEAIDNVSRGRTTIIIAHRLSTVVDSDIIFVMNLGKVVASGTHTELLENSEYYQELIKHQELK